MQRFAPSVIETARFLFQNPGSTERQVREYLLTVLEVPDRRIFCRRGVEVTDQDWLSMDHATWDTAETKEVSKWTDHEGIDREHVKYLHTRTFRDSASWNRFEVVHEGMPNKHGSCSWYTYIYKLIAFNGRNFSDFPHFTKVLDPRHSHHVRGYRHHNSKHNESAIHFEHDDSKPRRWFLTATGLTLVDALPYRHGRNGVWSYKDPSKHV